MNEAVNGLGIKNRFFSFTQYPQGQDVQFVRGLSVKWKRMGISLEDFPKSPFKAGGNILG